MISIRDKKYIEKCKFRRTKEPIDINDVNIDNVVLKKMRYFVGYVIYTINIMKSLLIELPKLNGSIAEIKIYAIHSY